MTATADAQTVLELLRQLPPRERLKVIAAALPDTERELSQEPHGVARSLRGLWKDMGFDVTEEDIDEARREMWANFPKSGSPNSSKLC